MSAIHETPAKPSVTAELTLVTPDVARTFLTANTDNRTVRPRRVNSLGGAILNGEWVHGVGAVILDETGRLIDGQHRCLAVVDAGQPVWLWVIRNAPAHAQAVIDVQLKRSAADALKFSGYTTDSNTAAAVIRLLILWQEGELRRSGSGQSPREVTNAEIVEWADGHDHESILGWLRMGQNISKSFPTISRATLSAALYIIAEVSPDGANEFADRLLNVRLQGRGDPMNALHARLLSAKNGRENMRAPGQLFCYFRTWNALVDNERLTILKIGTAGGGGAIAVPLPKRPTAPLTEAAS